MAFKQRRAHIILQEERASLITTSLLKDTLFCKKSNKFLTERMQKRAHALSARFSQPHSDMENAAFQQRWFGSVTTNDFCSNKPNCDRLFSSSDNAQIHSAWRYGITSKHLHTLQGYLFNHSFAHLFKMTHVGAIFKRYVILYCCSVFHNTGWH